MKRLHLLVLICGVLSCISCDRETDKLGIPHDIVVYTLKDYSTDNAPCHLDTLHYEELERVFSSEEIVSYYAKDHYFTLTAAAINRLRKIKSKVPFYLKVNNKVVYSGFFMPGYLSLACPGIVIDPISYSNNVIQVRYDFARAGTPVTGDYRNNNTLLKALWQQGKLIE